MKLIIKNKVPTFDFKYHDRCFVDSFDMGFISRTCYNWSHWDLEYNCNICNLGTSFVICRCDIPGIILCLDYRPIVLY